MVPAVKCTLGVTYYPLQGCLKNALNPAEVSNIMQGVLQEKVGRTGCEPTTTRVVMKHIINCYASCTASHSNIHDLSHNLITWDEVLSKGWTHNVNKEALQLQLYINDPCRVDMSVKKTFEKTIKTFLAQYNACII